MKINLSHRAETDLIRQFRYYLVDQDSPATAIRFRDSVRTTLCKLVQAPSIGKPVQSSIAGLRSWPVAGFAAIRVYYLVTANAVDVVRLIHGSQNVRRILAGEARFLRNN